MKKILLVFIVLITMNTLYAQSTSGEQISNRIAQRMKDTLSLAEGQRGQIFILNMQIHNLKQQAWQQYDGADALRSQLQQIENTRDSLYSTILTQQQFALYREKKKNLVHNN